MLGNFIYCNPTELYFGKDSLNYLKTELENYGKNIRLVYGGGSVKKNGIYDKVVEILKSMEGGYKKLTHEEIVTILNNSL